MSALMSRALRPTAGAMPASLWSPGVVTCWSDPAPAVPWRRQVPVLGADLACVEEAHGVARTTIGRSSSSDMVLRPIARKVSSRRCSSLAAARRSAAALDAAASGRVLLISVSSSASVWLWQLRRLAEQATCSTLAPAATAGGGTAGGRRRRRRQRGGSGDRHRQRWWWPGSVRRGCRRGAGEGGGGPAATRLRTRPATAHRGRGAAVAVAVAVAVAAVVSRQRSDTGNLPETRPRCPVRAGRRRRRQTIQIAGQRTVLSLIGRQRRQGGGIGATPPRPPAWRDAANRQAAMPRLAPPRTAARLLRGHRQAQVFRTPYELAAARVVACCASTSGRSARGGGPARAPAPRCRGPRAIWRRQAAPVRRPPPGAFPQHRPHRARSLHRARRRPDAMRAAPSAARVRPLALLASGAIVSQAEARSPACAAGRPPRN